MKIIAYCDGACEPINPGGVATYGYVIVDEHGVELKSGCQVVCEGDGATNNVAEYNACLRAISYISENHPHADVTVKSDSQLLIQPDERGLASERAAPARTTLRHRKTSEKDQISKV